MPPCIFTVQLDVRGRKTRGQQFTVSVRPPLAPGCSLLKVEVDGQAVTPGYGAGDFKAIGFAAAGQVTLEALRDDPYGRVAITISCPGCRPTTEEVVIGTERRGCVKFGLSAKAIKDVLDAIGKLGRR